MIDLRSDTITRPSDGMRRAMADAPVGDDVYGEDPTVRALEERIADLFGFEAALFVVTGSLANLLAVRALVAPGQEVLCESSAHIARAELGAHGAITGLTMRTWTHPNGHVDLAAIEGLFAPNLGPFFVHTAAVSVENTHNFAGGRMQPHEALRALRAFADERGIAVHVDGARIWNAHVASGASFRELGGQVADTLSVCLSKGMGAPMGSLVMGPQAMVDEARVVRKRLGGGWRQAGIVAAAASYALDHHLDRLADDHANAKVIAAAAGVPEDSVETNIVVIPAADAPGLVRRCAGDGVLVGAVGPSVVRAVTHLDVSAEQAKQAADVIASALGR